MAEAERPKSLSEQLADAAFIGDFVQARALLEAGADPNVRDDEGRTPLFSAVLAGHLGLVALLLEASADVNARDNDGWTALHWAVQEHLPEIAHVLLGRGADMNAQDQGGNSVLWRAVFSARGRDEIVHLLRKQGAKDDLANHAGETARQLAARIGSDVFTTN